MGLKQAIVTGPRRIEVQERPDPVPGPGQVLVRVILCGLCHSELASFLDGPGEGPGRALGHEVTGEVVRLGEGVAGPPVGTRVTGLFREGFAELAVTEADRVVALPDRLSVEAALGEPLSCVVSVGRRLRIELGDTAAVVGLGYMGLLTMQQMLLRGPARVVGVDPLEEARENALRFGATEVWAPERVPDDLLVPMRRRILPGTGAAVAVEASGTQPGLDLAALMTHEHGQLAIVGYHNDAGGHRDVDMRLWNWKALDVLNAHERRDDYKMDCMRRALALIASGRLPAGDLVTHRYPLDQVGAAFEALRVRPPGYVKGVVRMV